MVDKIMPPVVEDGRQGEENEGETGFGVEFETILAQINDIFCEWSNVCDDAEEEKFCEYCSYRKTAREMERFWGSPCSRKFETCPADFNPDSLDCPRQKQFIEIQEKEFELRKEIERLEALAEGLRAGDNA